MKLIKVPGHCRAPHYYCKRWLLAKKTAAITLYPWGVYHRDPEPTDKTIHHEEDHWLFFSEVGFFRGYGSYLNEFRKVGYWKNRWEIRARRVAAEKISK